jgi:ATP-dependent DNA helicase Q1
MKEMLEKGSQLRLLYVTPEKCSKSKQFMAKLQKMYQMGRLDRIAIGNTKPLTTTKKQYA